MTGANGKSAPTPADSSAVMRATSSTSAASRGGAQADVVREHGGDGDRAQAVHAVEPVDDRDLEPARARRGPVAVDHRRPAGRVVRVRGGAALAVDGSDAVLGHLRVRDLGALGLDRLRRSSRRSSSSRAARSRDRGTPGSGTGRRWCCRRCPRCCRRCPRCCRPPRCCRCPPTPLPLVPAAAAARLPPPALLPLARAAAARAAGARGAARAAAARAARSCRRAARRERGTHAIESSTGDRDQETTTHHVRRRFHAGARIGQIGGRRRRVRKDRRD